MINGLFDKYTNIGIPCRKDESMARHTSFRIGGDADLFVSPETVDQLVAAINNAKEADVPFFILGRGSNILVSDEGYCGVVITTENIKTIEIIDDRIICSCGATLSQIAIAARDAGLAGFSFAYGIPGSLGGAVYMNAGAYGGEMANVVVSTTYYDTEKCEICTCVGDEHNFGYRTSVYKEHPERVIISAEIKLTAGNTDEIKSEMDDYMNRRKTKQPLEFPSAGSTFKRYPGHFTGQLIEECGLKGKTIGGAQVSEKHAGFVINIGGATAKDVRDLIAFIKDTIREKYGFELECEVIIVG